MHMNRKPFSPFSVFRPVVPALTILALLAASLTAAAQAPAPAAAPAPEPAVSPELARAQAMLAQSQAKTEALQQEMLALDDQIDARINELVELLKGARDSTESKTKVMDVKKKTIESLEKFLQAYNRERGRRLGELQRPAPAAKQEELQQQVAAIDSKIDQRVNEIVELAASMSTHEDLQRYETHYADWGVAKIETDEYRANKKQRSRANQTQSQVAEELEKAIAGLERDIALVPQRLPRDRQEAELARLNGLLEQRRTELRTLESAYPEKGRQVGKREADRLMDDLHDTQQKVRALWNQLLAKANVLSTERRRTAELDAHVRMLAAEASSAPPTPPAAE